MELMPGVNLNKQSGFEASGRPPGPGRGAQRLSWQPTAQNSRRTPPRTSPVRPSYDRNPCWKSPRERNQKAESSSNIQTDTQKLA